MTRTYAVLDVPVTVYAAVRALLAHAGYAHAVVESGEGEVLDMHGIALKSRGGTLGTDLTVSTLLSSRTKEGRVELALNGEITQMDLDKAREVRGMLDGAIEAAVSDALIYAFLTTKVGLSDEQAFCVLLDFRELRQGSKGTVHPS